MEGECSTENCDEVYICSLIEDQFRQPDPCRKIEPKWYIPFQGFHKLIEYRNEDYLNRSSGAGLLCCSATFELRYGLQGDFRRESKGCDYLFQQRRHLGEVAMFTKVENNVNLSQMMFLINCNQEGDNVSYFTMRKCLLELKEIVRKARIREIAIPMVDTYRKITWVNFMKMLDDEFWNMGVKIVAYKYYYLSIP